MPSIARTVQGALPEMHNHQSHGSQHSRKIMKPKHILRRLALAALLLVASRLQFTIARAQDTTFTYQGRVLDNGANFSGAGLFKFALVTSSNANLTATATANAPSGGFITGYVVTSGGNGYVTAPAVTVFGGGGSNAPARRACLTPPERSASRPGSGFADLGIGL